MSGKAFALLFLANFVVSASPAATTQESLQDIQDLCMSAIAALPEQISCIKRGVKDSAFRANGPTRLYLLTADKLLDDFISGRTTAAAARVDLQRSLLEADARNKGQFSEVNSAEDTAARQEEAERLAQVNDAQHQAVKAVSFCVNQVNEQYKQLLAHGTSQQKSWVLMNANANETPQMHCSSNPNYYQTLPKVPTTTHCRGDSFAGQVELNCQTE